MAELPTNFLPNFTPSGNLSRDMRNIKIAESLSLAWYKGQLDYHWRKAGAIRVINGEEFYTSMNLGSNTYDFFIKGRTGYHQAEVLRLIGFQDEDLKELHQTWRNDSVDGMYQEWRASQEYDSATFKRYIDNLRQELFGIDTIEIDYENTRYKNSAYPTEPTRPYVTKEAIYGAKLGWGAKLKNPTSTQDLWRVDDRQTVLPNIDNKDAELLWGNAIRFYSGTTDVTNTVDYLVINAVRAMIMYSGTDFMDRVSSTKVSEKSYTVDRYMGMEGGTESDLYTSVIGTEVYTATIKSSMVNDQDDYHWKRYSAICTDSGRGTIGKVCQYEPNKDDGRTILTSDSTSSFTNLSYFAGRFWDYTQLKKDEGTSFYRPPVVDPRDEFLFLRISNDSGAYIRVEEFKKLSKEQVGYYLGKYFDIEVTTKSGSWFDGFLGAVVGLLGKLFDLSYDLLQVIPAAKLQLQLMTKVVNETFDSDLSEKEVYALTSQVVLTTIGIVFSPVSMGASLAISTTLTLAIQGSKAEEKKTEAEKKAEREKAKKEIEQEDRKKEAIEEKRREKTESSGEEDGEDDFQSFLRNPLYKLDREKSELKNSMKSQFKLL